MPCAQRVRFNPHKSRHRVLWVAKHRDTPIHPRGQFSPRSKTKGQFFEQMTLYELMKLYYVFRSRLPKWRTGSLSSARPSAQKKRSSFLGHGKQARGGRSGKERFVVHKYYLYILYFMWYIRIFFVEYGSPASQSLARAVVSSKKALIASNSAVPSRCVGWRAVFCRDLLSLTWTPYEPVAKKKIVSYNSPSTKRVAMECLRSTERNVIRSATLWGGSSEHVAVLSELAQPLKGCHTLRCSL